FHLFTASPPPAKVAVPGVVGRTEAAARALLQQQGFRVGTTLKREVKLGDRRIGQVIGQDPAKDTKVEPGSTVTLTVAMAPSKVAVPDVTQYQTFQEARQALVQVGLGANRVNVNSDKPQDTIVGSNPPANTMVTPGTIVAIQVSNGTSPTPTTTPSATTTMPDVVGKTQDEAKGFLDAQGYTNVQPPQELTPTDGSDFAPGTVWKTDPAKDTPISKDQQITLYVVPVKPPTSPKVTSVSPSSGKPAGGD